MSAICKFINEIYYVSCFMFYDFWEIQFQPPHKIVILFMCVVDSLVCVLCIYIRICICICMGAVFGVDFHTLNAFLIIENAKNSKKFPRFFLHSIRDLYCMFYCCCLFVCFSGIWNYGKMCSCCGSCKTLRVKLNKHDYDELNVN